MQVVKAQSTDLNSGASGVGVKTTIKQSIDAFKECLMYVLMGDEGSIFDGIVPDVFTETFQVLPLSFDLGKLIFSGTFDIVKKILRVESFSLSIIKELATLKDIRLGCQEKIS